LVNILISLQVASVSTEHSVLRAPAKQHETLLFWAEG